MASAVLSSINEPHWDERNVYMRKYTPNSTPHPQFHSRFNPNPNPNPSPNFNLTRQVQNVSALSHLRQANEPLPRAAPSPLPPPRANNNVPFSGKPNAVYDRNDSFHREYVTFNLGSYSRNELKDLKKRLISDLDRVRGVLNRIEAPDFASRTPIAPQVQLNQPSLAPNVSRHHRKPEKVGGKSKKLTGQKRTRAIASGKDHPKRQAVEGDKFFVSMMRKCRQILMKLMKHRHGYVFDKPVDVKGLKLYDYFDIIKHPMDLGTVMLRLDRNEYRTPQDFAADVRLTFNNAITYNPKGQDVHAMAVELLGDFEEKFKPAYKKYEAEHRKVATIMQVNHQKNLSQPAPIPPPNALHEPLPVARKSEPVRSHSTLLNQRQFQSVPVAPFFAPPAVKSPPQPVFTPSSAKMRKPKAKDPNKRHMIHEEKAKLAADLQNLPSEKMDQVVQIVKRRTPNLTQEGDEIELDFEALDNETLWELERFVGNHKKAMSKSKRQGVTEDAAAKQLNKSPGKAPTPGQAMPQNKKVGFGDEDVDIVEEISKPEQAMPKNKNADIRKEDVDSVEEIPIPEHVMPKNKKVDVGEEDVDIGEEIPGENFPPVQIEKDGPCVSSGSSSSSSSSSGSDSSSSDSDSGSSSGSDSDEDSVQSPYVEAKEAGTT
ncbi:transcription factor GTE2-like [Lycium barbarum]|uniref:transcription factor GTE2-like n=1 Tax=Lycium barbarum TaxID=112863 RepID=UPI00293E00D6|nr:transcription factor GTE2-like [Lycium barbarum]